MMMGLMRLSFLHYFLLWPVLAERHDLRFEEVEEEPDPEEEYVKVKNIIKGTDTICGGPEIWSIITEDPTSYGVRNIKWGKVDATAESFMNEMESKIQALKHKIELQGKRIDAAKAKETHIQEVPVDAIRGLVTAIAEPFNGLQDAQRTKCGMPSIRPRAPRKSFEKSEEAMDPALKRVFNGKVRMGQAPFLSTCNEMLPCGDDAGPTGCYCKQLCQLFRDKAQKVSDRTAGEHAGVCAKLEREAAEWEEELQKRKEEKEECAAARKELQTYAKQMKVLTDEADERFKALQKAQSMLDDAQWELGDLQDALDEEEAAAKEALEALEGANTDVAEAKEALEELEAQLEKQEEAMKDAMEALKDATDKLEKAKNADFAMRNLKELVSLAMLKMHLFFNEVVEQRLDSIGINLDLDINALFTENPDDVNSKKSVKTAVEAMHTFCAEDGKVAIDDMKEKVDLSPLCAFGSQEDIEKGIHEAALNAVQVVKERLEMVKEWINPYRGQADMSKEKADELVKQGEPAGLREVTSFFGDTSFYKYLENWKLGGPFLRLLQDLAETVGSLSQSVQDLHQETDDLKEQIRKTNAARDEAEAQLMKVTEAQGLAEEKKAEILKKVADLKEDSQSMEQAVTDYEAMVEEARKRYKAALDKIEATHKESTSFLESWSEGVEMHRLRGDVNKARESMMTEKIQADLAEQAYRSILARLADAERIEDLRKSQGGVSHHFRLSEEA